MPVLMELRREYSKTKPLKGFKIAGCLHVTKETAVLVETLVAAGAQVSWSGCNPLSTQDDVAAALAKKGISIFAWHGMNVKEFYWCIEQTLKFEPNLTLDDGADLIFTIHNKYPKLADKVIGGTEETTTGVKRLRAMAKDGALKYPVIAVNDAETKWDFDNVYGTGQSSIDGILRATNVFLAGKNFVVAGYGHCGRGVARRAAGMGANVIVTEVKQTAALKAALDPQDFRRAFDTASANPMWHVLEAPETPRFPWNESSNALRRPLRDPHGLCHIPKAHLGVPGKAHQHMGVVCQERPAASGRGTHELKKYEKKFVHYNSFFV